MKTELNPIAQPVSKTLFERKCKLKLNPVARPVSEDSFLPTLKTPRSRKCQKVVFRFFQL